MRVVNLKGSVCAKSIATGSVTITYNFAYHHMRSAIEFAKLASSIEGENSGKGYGPFFEELRMYVSSAIILSVCALEANINEQLAGSGTILRGYANDLRAQFFNLIEHLSMQEKYQLGLIVNRKPPWEFNKEPFQSLKCLIALRNAFVHYKPESDNDLRYSKKLEARLAPKIKQRPFVRKTDNFLTKRAMSYSCAKWAVNTSLNFSSEYCRILDIKDRFSDLSRL